MKRCLIILVTSSLFFVHQSSAQEVVHYVFPKFEAGTILMKTGLKKVALLNYNSLMEEMIFDNGGNKMAISDSEIKNIDTVFIKERKFIVLKNNFKELVHQSKWDVFIEHKCKVTLPGSRSGYGGTSQTTSTTTLSTLLAKTGGNGVYELKLPDDYKTTSSMVYWLRKDGEIMKIRNMREFKKIFGKSENYKSYLKNNNVKYSDSESIVTFIKFFELEKN